MDYSQDCCSKKWRLGVQSSGTNYFSIFVSERVSPEHEIRIQQIHFLVIAAITVDRKVEILLKVTAVICQDTPVDSLCPNIGNRLWIFCRLVLALLYILFDKGLNLANPLLQMGLCVWIILCILKQLFLTSPFFSYIVIVCYWKNWNEYASLSNCIGQFLVQKWKTN